MDLNELCNVHGARGYIAANDQVLFSDRFNI